MNKLFFYFRGLYASERKKSRICDRRIKKQIFRKKKKKKKIIPLKNQKNKKVLYFYVTINVHLGKHRSNAPISNKRLFQRIAYKLHGSQSEERNLVRDRRIRFSLRETDVGPSITFFTVYRDSFFPAAFSQKIDDARYAGNDTIVKEKKKELFANS